MIREFIATLSNREIATIIWLLVILFLLFLKSKSVRKSMLEFLISVIKMWKLFSFTLFYIFITVFLLYKLNLWNIGLVKVTILWLFGFAITMVINFAKIFGERGYFKRIIIEIIGLTTIIPFLVNFYSFSLWKEMFIVPIMILSVCISTVSVYDKKNIQAGKCANKVINMISIIIFIYSFYKTILNFSNIANINTLREMLLPVLLSFSFIPFVYFLSLYSRWENEKLLKKLNH